MATTKTTDKTETANAPQEAPSKGAIALRLNYPKSLQEYANIDARQWQVLSDVIFPNAQSSQSIVLAVQYCKARNLDIMKKVVHIVPMYSTALKALVDTIWPGIAEVRITATRTGDYAGKDAAEFGDEMEREFTATNQQGNVTKTETVYFPEWCCITVYRMVRGVRCAFVGPKVYWDEAYATESRFSDIPNEMWKSRRNGQLEKCAEAAALRAAFPEELGGEYTAEEMHGRVIEGTAAETHYATTGAEAGVMTPPRPKQSEFEQSKPQDAAAAEKAKPAEKSAKAAEPQKSSPDGRPEPPPPDGVVDEVPQGQERGPRRDQDVPSSYRKDPENAVDVEEERDEDEDGPSANFAEAQKMLARMTDSIKSDPDMDLDQFSTMGKTNIAEFADLTDDERAMLRGTWLSTILEAKRAKSKPKKSK